MSVQELLRTYDCAAPGCPDDASEPGGFCRFCQPDDVRVTPTSEPEENPVTTCKVPGCTNPEKGSAGPWKGMCGQHISEEVSRRQSIRYSTKRKPKAAAKDPARGKPQQAHRASTLVELARAVEVAESEVAAAQRAHAEALGLLRAAVEAA